MSALPKARHGLNRPCGPAAGQAGGLDHPALAPGGRMMTGDIERIRQDLQFIPASDRDTWVKMGMAVKSEFGDAGFDLWDGWSKQDDSYKVRDARDVRKSISAAKLRQPDVTAPALGRRDEGTRFSDALAGRESIGLPAATSNIIRAPGRAAMDALKRAPAQAWRLWWELYRGLRLDRELSQRWRP